MESFESGTVPAGWTSQPEGNLSIDREKKKSGEASLLWKWSWFTTVPDQKAFPWDDPNFRILPENFFSYLFDNSLTYTFPTAVQSASQPNSGVSLSIYLKRSYGGIFRLELLSGEKTVATAWYRLSENWNSLKMPYCKAGNQGITGFRIIAPTNLTPYWNWGSYAPACVAIDNVSIDSGDGSYNGLTVENFEEATVPATWKADANGSVEINTARHLSGKSCLLWSWKRGGASLSCKASFANINKKQSLAFWLYNENPSEERLSLEFLKNGQPLFSCWYFLNFKGWHVLEAPYEDLGWMPGVLPDEIRFSAPQKIAQGSLYFDFVNFNAEGARRARSVTTPSVDMQQPWIGFPELLKTPEACHFSQTDLSVGRPWIPGLVPQDQITPEQRQFIEENTPPKPKRGTNPGKVDPEKIAFILDGIKVFDIKDTNGILTGRPIDSLLNMPPDALNYGRGFAALLKNAALAYDEARVKGDSEAEKTLLEAVTLLLRYMNDQGITSCSTNNPSFFYHNTVTAILKISDDLPPEVFAPFLEDALFSATRGVPWGGSLFEKEPNGNSDAFWANYTNLPSIVCKFKDPARSLQCIQAVRRGMNRICTRGDLDPFGPDGTFYHHDMHHWDYASYEFPLVLKFLEYFHGSCFQLDPKCYETCKKFIFAMAWSSCKYSMPPTLPARPGATRDVNLVDFAGRLADLGSADGKEGIDRDLASLYLWLNKDPNSARARIYKSMGIEPYVFEGHHTLNGAATSLHRRDDWLVGMIGLTKYTGGLEIYGGAKNSYSSFARNGSVYVVSSGNPTSCEASGWSFDGWDSRHYPGATNALVPPQALWYAMQGISNKVAFAGGADLGKNGIWGYEHDADGIRFHKSAFCFDRRVTLLTSDIERTDKGLCSGTEPFVTTLFQNAFAGEPSAEPCFVDNTPIPAFPSETNLPAGRPHWLLDNRSTGYYIPSGTAPLKMLRRHQTWYYLWPDYLLNPSENPMHEPQPPEFTGTNLDTVPDAVLAKYYKPTENRFALAYFDHGAKPETPACAYTLIVRSNPQEMANFAQLMSNPATAPNRTFEQNSNAHILWDRETQTTGYVIFSGSRWAPQPANHDLRTTRLLSVSRPCLIMVQEGGNHCKLSVASTDWKDNSPLIFEITGHWNVASADSAQAYTVKAVGGNTRIEIPWSFENAPDGYMPIHFTLSK